MDTKVCSKCQIDKELLSDNFRQCKYQSGILYFKATCKICESKIQMNRVKKNGLTQSQKTKKTIYIKKWKKQNKDKINNDYRKRIANEPNFRLRKNVSRAINHAIKKQFSSKNASIMHFLSYSMNDLKMHLESQFTTNMNWENYGLYWEIDHIIPQSCLSYTHMNEINFKKCWSLNNLRPLEVFQNRSDGSTRIRHKFFNGVNDE